MLADRGSAATQGWRPELVFMPAPRPTSRISTARASVVRACPGEGRLTTPCCRFPRYKGWTAVAPYETFMPPPAAGHVAQEAAIRVRLLVMLADRLTSVRQGCPNLTQSGAVLAAVKTASRAPAAVACAALRPVLTAAARGALVNPRSGRRNGASIKQRNWLLVRCPTGRIEFNWQR